MRVLFMFYVENTKAASIAISSFLAGLAFSSIIFAKLGHRKTEKHKISLIFWMQLASAFYGYLVLKNYEIIPVTIDYVTHQFSSDVIRDMLRFAIIWLFLFVPAFFFGGAFPLVNGIYLSAKENAGHDTGVVYFWDTFGAIIGALLAGFFLLPHLGLPLTILTAVVGNIAICGLLPTFRYILLIIPLLVAFSFYESYLTRQSTLPNEDTIKVFTPIMDRKPIDYENNPELLKNIEKLFFFGNVIYKKESPYGTVRVLDIEDNYRLFINYRDMCTNLTSQAAGEDMLATRVTDNIKSEAEVLNIGLGCGMTAKSVLKSSKVKHLDIAEINPVVLEANQKFFDVDPPFLFNNSKVNLMEKDGAEHLRITEKKYDAIILDIEEVSVIHSAPFFTKEYFQIIKDKMKPNGVFGLWSFDVRWHPEFAKIMYNTARSVYSYVYMRLDHGALLIYASERPLDVGQVTEKFDEKKIIDKIMSTPIELINTLDKPILENYYRVNAIFGLPKDYHDPQVYYPEKE